MTRWTRLSMLVAVAALLAPTAAVAHWCNTLWGSSYNIVVRPATDTVVIPASGTGSVDLYVQNNMGYPLSNFTLTATMPDSTYTLVRKSSAVATVSGYLMPGERVKYTLEISKSGGASLPVENITFGVDFGEGAQSVDYPQSPGRAVVIKKTNGALFPAQPMPNIGVGFDQSYGLLHSAVADFGTTATGMQKLLEYYCAGRASWSWTNSMVSTYCPSSPLGTTCPTTRPGSTSADNAQYQHLWGAPFLAIRKSALTSAQLAELRKRLVCGANDAHLGFSGTAMFVLGYLGEDAGARAFLQGKINGTNANEALIAKAAILMMGSSADRTAHLAAVTTGMDSANQYVGGACQAALAIVDRNDAAVTGSNRLLARARWVYPDDSGGMAFYAAHLLAIVAWDRRGWAASAGEQGMVSFYGERPGDTTAPRAPANVTCTPSTGGNLRIGWNAVTQDVDGGAETISNYRVYWGLQARPAGATRPGEQGFDYGHVDSTTSIYRDYPAMDGTQTYYFTVIATDAANNSSVYSSEVNCKPRYAPVAQLSCTPTSGTTPLHVTCTGTSTDANGASDTPSYSFQLDTGSPSSTNPAIYDFATAGAHSVRLTVTDTTGLTGTAGPVTITATAPQNQPPVAQASATPTSGRAPLSVQFSSTGSSDPEGGALTYSWSFGDGTPASTQSNPTHVYQNPGTFDAVLTVTDNGSLSATRLVRITVAGNNPPVVTTASASPLSGRSPLTVHFDGTGVTDPDGDTVTLTWSFGDGTANATGASVNHTYNAEGTFTARLSAQDNGTPTLAPVTKSFTITVANPAPAAPSNVRCTTDPVLRPGAIRVSWNAVTLDVNGGATSIDHYEVQWGTAAGNRPNLDPAALALTRDYTSLVGTSRYYYAVRAFDTNGRASAASTEVNCVAPYPPVAQISCSPTSGIAPLSVTCNGTASTDPNGAADLTGYSFQLDTNAPVSSNPATFAGLTAGSHTVRLTVTDSTSLTASATATIAVTDPANEAPVAQASATPTGGRAPLTVQFSSSGSSDPEGTGLGYSWDFGDGTAASTAASPTHTFQTAGTFNVMLTVTDNGSPRLSATAPLQITTTGNTAPNVLAATASPTSGRAPLQVSFDGRQVTDAEHDTITLTWAFGDGSPNATGATATHTYASPGTYTATVSAVDDGTPDVGPVQKSFSIVLENPPPRAPANVLCAVDTAREGELRVSWDPVAQDSAGRPTTVTRYHVHSGNAARPQTVAAPGDEGFAYPRVDVSTASPRDYTALDGALTWYFALTAEDADGQQSPYSAEVPCIAPYAPIARLTCTPASGTAPLHVECDASATTDPNGAADLVSLSFALGTYPVQTANPATYDFPAAGSHQVLLTVEDSSGLSSTATATITVTDPQNEPPTAVATATPTSGQAPLAVQFSSSGSADPEGGALTFAWNFADGTTSSEENPQHTFLTEGRYDVALQVTDPAGAQANTFATVTVTTNHAPETATASATPLSGVAPLTVQFDGTGVTDPDGDGITLTWSFGDGTADATGAQATHTYEREGTYTATLSAQDDGTPSMAALPVEFTITVAPPARSNRAPDCTAAFVTPLQGEAPLTITMDASGCTDPDGDPLIFQWRVPTSATSETEFSTALAVHTVSLAGTHQVNLLVRDDVEGAMSTAREFEVTVTEAAAPPTPPDIKGYCGCGAGAGAPMMALALAGIWALRRRRRS